MEKRRAGMSLSEEEQALGRFYPGFSDAVLTEQMKV